MNKTLHALAIVNMKTFVLVLPFVFFVSCSKPQESKINGDPPKSRAATKAVAGVSLEADMEVASKSTPAVSENDLLKQQGSYAELFNQAPGNCDFVSREMLAEALQTPIETIVQGHNECTFHLEEPNGISTRFYFAIEIWGNERVLKDIKEAKKNAEIFGKDSLLSQMKTSDTGDTYLSMHQNRMVRILNETSDSAIAVFYTSKTDPGDTDYEKKKLLKGKAREQAYAIANFLLKKYQK